MTSACLAVLANRALWRVRHHELGYDASMAKRPRKMIDTSVPEHEEEVPPSRSKKREVRKQNKVRLEDLAARLTKLRAGDLAALELGENIEREVVMLRDLKRGHALARQRRLVASLLRPFDLDELEARLGDVGQRWKKGWHGND